MERPRSDLHKSYLDLVKDEMNDQYGLPWNVFYHTVGLVIYTYGTNSKIPKAEDQQRFLRCVHTALKNTKERLQKAGTEIIVNKTKENVGHVFTDLEPTERPDQSVQYRPDPDSAA